MCDHEIEKVNKLLTKIFHKATEIKNGDIIKFTIAKTKWKKVIGKLGLRQ